MKCKGKFIKLLAVLFIGFFAFSICFQGANESVNPQNAHYIPTCESLRRSHSLLDLRDCIPSKEWEESNPLAYLFQIIFILFFISPPLIVLMLFLIWKELKERNRLK